MEEFDTDKLPRSFAKPTLCTISAKEKSSSWGSASLNKGQGTDENIDYSVRYIENMFAYEAL